MKIDILAFGAHPDDVELSASGTLLKHIDKGYKVGIVDLTQGELGSRGTAQTRFTEAGVASELLGVEFRENLNLGDGFFEVNQENLLRVIEMIRKYRPEIVFCNAVSDRHPDHSRGGDLVARACFLSGLLKIKTFNKGKEQEHWRPKSVYRYVQDNWVTPDIVVDISDYFEVKMSAVLAYKTQFYSSEEDNSVQTPISSPEFLEFIKAKASVLGRIIGVRYAEGFTVERPVGVHDFFDLD